MLCHVLQAEQEVAQLREKLEQEQLTNKHEEQRVSLLHGRTD